MQDSSGELSSSEDSIWWRDLCKINLLDEHVEYGFTGCFKSNCMNGKDTLFWHTLWVGDKPLRFSFPDLYDLSPKKFCSVADILSWVDGRHVWDVQALFSQEDGSVSVVGAAAAFLPSWHRFCELVDGFTPSDVASDTYGWFINSDKDFTVAGISWIINESKSVAWELHVIRSLKVMWSIPLPPKIKMFSWRFFVERLPSKDLLLLRGVSNLANPDCEFCGDHVETSFHLFFHCHMAKEIWKHMFEWLDISEAITMAEFLDFGVLQEKVKNISRKAKINVVWLSTIWCLWIMRNGIIFDGKVFCFDVVCSNIIFLSWRWLSSGYSKFRSNYYDWFKLPLSDAITL
ncbi:uncharacterized protein LOC131650619 [Vicia villosa]|uniref:uncharacterized protein LOC131650619 n=1 Tax=Vicia villosa TaxID=3911 RepID=UPI00273BBF17|nr:uncharacterized protein LOC131650619 [Vicia villosa]